jgi:hypothetical protein
MATKGKAAVAKKAPVQAATAPKATKAAKEVKAAATAVGGFVEFLGYDETVPENEQVLTAGEVYRVMEETEAGFVVQFANPDFNAKQKEDAEKNPKHLEVEVFTEEVKAAAAPAEAAPAAVATATKVKGGKAPVEKAAKPVKEKAVKAVKEPKPPKVKAEKAEEGDDLPDLTEDQEDADVLALVNESDDLVATAQELEGNIGRSEYQIGGILYHIKKSKSYQDLNDVYKENAGFAAFLHDFMNIEYRKAMHLIDIYVTFSQLGIENPAETVARIGWTKASKITKPMQLEGAVPDDLIKLAEDNTVADLTTAIQEQTVNVGGTAGTAVKRVTMKFRFFEEEGTALIEILAAAKEAQGLKSDEEALAYILEDWAAMNGGEVEAAAAPAQSAPVGTKAKGSAKPSAAAAAH